MKGQQQHEDEPLLIEITPAMAYDLIGIIKHLPPSEVETTPEEVVAMALCYFRNRLESGYARFLEDDQNR